MFTHETYVMTEFEVAFGNTHKNSDGEIKVKWEER